MIVGSQLPVRGVDLPSSGSCAVFQMKELWSITRKSSCHLVRFHFLEISRCWLTEQTCLHNVLVAMCLGDVPICHC